MGGSERRGGDNKISNIIVSTVVAAVIASTFSIFAAVQVGQSKDAEHNRRISEIEVSSKNDSKLLVEVSTDVKWIKEKMAQKTNP